MSVPHIPSSVFSNPGNYKSWPSITDSRYQSFSARCSRRVCSSCQLEKTLLMIVLGGEELAYDHCCNLEKSVYYNYYYNVRLVCS